MDEDAVVVGTGVGGACDDCVYCDCDICDWDKVGGMRGAAVTSDAA